jgi:hypothetical protein
MAKLTGPHTCESMNALAGAFDKQLDFYFWKGIPCVRKWPRWRRSAMTDEQIASSAAFQNAMQLKATILPQIRDNFKARAAGTTQTWADVLVTNAMAYYAAGLGYAPAITSLDITYGSGIKSLTIGFDHPCKPVLQFYRGLQPVSYTKKFRGKTTTCKKPGQLLGAIAYPMALVFDHMVTIVPTNYGKSKSVSLYGPSLELCPAYLAAHVAEYAALAESETGMSKGGMFQRIWRSGSYWQGEITGWYGAQKFDQNIDSVWEPTLEGDCQPRADLSVFNYGAFEVISDGWFTTSENPKLDTYFELIDYTDLVQWVFAPFSWQDINGVAYFFEGSLGPVDPAGFFRCKMPDNEYRKVYPGNFSVFEIVGINVEEYNAIDAFFMHFEYLHIPVYPICGLGYSSQQLAVMVGLRDVSFTLGARWTYTFTFPNTLKPGIDIFCSFVDAAGNAVLMYPVTVTDQSQDGWGWGALMADPYEEE